MARVYERLGSKILRRELENLGLEETPQYDPYEDETKNKQAFHQLAVELEPMPEVGDLYIGAEILLPREDQMARGHVVAKSRDVNGNVVEDPTQIQFWIQGRIKWSLLGLRLQN